MIVILIVVVVMVMLKMFHLISFPWLGIFSPLVVSLTIIFLWFYVSRKMATNVKK